MRLASLVASLLPHVLEPRRSTADTIRETVAARPGVTVGELTRRARVSSGTMYYHIRHLENAGTIHTVVAGRRRLVFPGPATADPSDRAKKLGLLRGRTANRIATRIVAEPGASIISLIRCLDESPRSVYYHVRRLKKADLVWSSSVTRYRDLRPAPTLAELLAAIPPHEVRDEQ